MEKETKILIGASALAVAYYLYNVNKAASAVSPIGKATMPPITTPASPVATTPVSPVATTPVSPSLKDAIKDLNIPVKISPQPNPNYDDSIAKAKAREVIAAKIAADEAAALAAQQEADRLAEMLAYEEENARQEAMRLANQKAYQALQDIEKPPYDSAKKREQDIREAEDAAREKAMNAFMYPTCPEGFEWFRGNCTPSYVVVEQKAISGEGLVLRDMYNSKVSLVQSCPDEYVKQGINCIPRYSLSPQQLQVMAMEEAGMVQTSDGQWYLDAKSAAAAQAIIDASKAMPRYTERQRSVNDAICSITTSGVINNPYSSATNGMSLRQYIGQYKVTAGELNIARASCPNSVYSSGQIFGGGTDDNALGYKDYLQF